MLNKLIPLILCLFLLSSCVDGFRDYFKKSANNQWLDSRGFKGGKRRPLYNKKYISLAKRNVIDENFDDDEDIEIDEDHDSETVNNSRVNRKMYMNMIKQDRERKKRLKLEQQRVLFKSKLNRSDDEYPSIIESDSRINRSTKTNEQDVQKELAEIKIMLQEAKRDLTKYKCPLEETAKSKSQSNN